MTNQEAMYAIFSAIETGTPIDPDTKEGLEIYLLAEKSLEEQLIQSCSYCQDGVYYDVLGSICGYSFCPMCGNSLDEAEEE